MGDLIGRLVDAHQRGLPCTLLLEGGDAVRCQLIREVDVELDEERGVVTVTEEGGGVGLYSLREIVDVDMRAPG